MDDSKDILISDFGNNYHFEMRDIRVFYDTKVYNASMIIAVKNEFLQCVSESYVFHEKNLLAFLSKLQNIYDNLSGEAHLESVEAGKCILHASANNLGYIIISGKLEDLSHENSCKFTIPLDQTCFEGKKLTIK
ncbi:MAG: hypothetical protein WC509_08340 [Candidatus Izemoplasmatales bacterium]